MAAVRFAVIVEGEVALTIVADDESENDAAQRTIAAFRSPHQIIEFTDEAISHGWTYDGVSFNPPAE